MRRANLTVQKREGTGKGVARKLRAKGRIPGILYGEKRDPLPISVDRKVMAHLIHGEAGENTILNVTFEGQTEGGKDILALTKEASYDPVTEVLQHVDLMRISLDHPIQTSVALHLMGTPIGVRNGGVLEHLVRYLEIRCLPLDIPEAIEIDVSNLQISDSLTVANLKVSEKIQILAEPRTAIAIVESPAKLAAAAAASQAPAEAAEGAEGEEGAEKKEGE